jgi:predicted O-methyltransferase YrrM
MASLRRFSEKKKVITSIRDAQQQEVTREIEAKKPSTIVEVGGHVGYNMLGCAVTHKANGGAKYYVIEKDPNAASVLGDILEKADLADFVTVVHERTTMGCLTRVGIANGVGNKADMFIFNDQKMDCFQTLLTAEEQSQIGHGSTVISVSSKQP